jgi:hypothetical protein
MSRQRNAARFGLTVQTGKASVKIASEEKI